MLSNSLSLSFAQKWQQIAEEQAKRSQELLAAEGITFYDANLAHQWRMLRKDLRHFEATGDESIARDIRLEMDMLVRDDEAAEARNRQLLGLDREIDPTDPDYLYEVYLDQADALYWDSFAEADAYHAQGGY